MAVFMATVGAVLYLSVSLTSIEAMRSKQQDELYSYPETPSVMGQPQRGLTTSEIVSTIRIDTTVLLAFSIV
jgi:hypothetical protein